MIIGFGGGTGAGKSTLVEHAARLLGKDNTLIIAQDHYYKHHPELPFEERCQINFDHPDAIDFALLTSHIQHIHNGNTIHRPVYSFEEHLRKNETTKHQTKKFILVEGILVFAHQPLVELFDYKVYIHADKDIRVKRRVARDIASRGRSENEVLERFQTTLHAMHDKYIAPHKQKANLVLINNTNIDAAKKQLSDWIKTISR